MMENMEVSQSPIAGLKRRQPCHDDDQRPSQVQTDFNECSGTGHSNNISVSECNCKSERHHQCSKYIHLNAKRSCATGVSSLHRNETENEMPMEMQYDFFAMQCNNNSSALNLNTTMQAHHTAATTIGPESEAQVYPELRQSIPAASRQCQRCISGEPGHINHILS